jgi:lysophospholipase L1-like esterase
MIKYILLVIVVYFTVSGYAADIRIACVGNSITSGAGDPKTDPNTYPAQLGVLMGSGYDIQNFGVSGRTMLKNGDFPIWNEQAFIDALDFKPNIITILLGTNDSKPWCWEFKAEFIPDYIAMIDTFLAINPDAQIYLCNPPPAFSVQWGIRDSIITTDIIPMINQIAVEKELPVIDFYMPFIDKRALFPDDIHPSKEGCWEIAKILYKHLSGKDVSTINEVNLALHKMVETPNSVVRPEVLVDGDLSTFWPCNAGASFVINLGAADSIDMFQVIFRENTQAKFKVEISSDNTNWLEAVDQTTRSDSSAISVDKIEPVLIQYARFTMTDPGGGGDQVYLAEFRILKKAPLHAPLFNYTLDKIFDEYLRINLIMTPAATGGYMKYFYKLNADDPYTAPMGYQLAGADTFKVTVRLNQTRYYLARYYEDGIEVESDTMILNYKTLPVIDQRSLPADQFNLYQNFPNPFNPKTVISYSVGANNYSPVQVELGVYNLLGQKVSTLVSQRQTAGQYQVVWDASGFASGIYFYKLETEDHFLIKRMLLLK